MIKLEKLEKGEFFEDAFLVSYRYNKDYLNKMRSLKYKRYVPDKKAWEIPSSELKHLVDLFGVDDINVNAKYLEGLVEKEESKAEETPEPSFFFSCRVGQKWDTLRQFCPTPIPFLSYQRSIH